jgi:O-antigen ligase
VIVTHLYLPRSRVSATRTGVDLDSVVRSLLFIGAFLLVWVSLHPFQSLADPLPETTEGGDRANQIGYLLVFAVFVAWAYFHDLSKLRSLISPILIATFLWFVLCVVTSWEPALSARRLAFTLIVLSIAAITLQLPKNLRHFADLMAVSTLIVIALCYLGVSLAPSVSVHQATDFLEPEHAGSWRGLFPHKNQAGATMIIFILVGLFVARVRSIAIGALIVGLSAIFLVMTHSKTPLLLLPIVMLLSAFVTHTRSRVWAIVVTTGGLVIFNLFSVGSVYFKPVEDILNLVMSDASFTGRTDIWKFALQELARSPITGFGFSAFWGTPHVVFGLGELSTWATAATDAHNAYLNLAVTVGIPGMLLVVMWIVLFPVVDFFRQVEDPCNRVLSIFFLRIWLFGIYASCFESAIFQQVGEVWFIFIMSVFGLRQLTGARVQL